MFPVKSVAPTFWLFTCPASAKTIERARLVSYNSPCTWNVVRHNICAIEIHAQQVKLLWKLMLISWRWQNHRHRRWGKTAIWHSRTRSLATTTTSRATDTSTHRRRTTTNDKRIWKDASLKSLKPNGARAAPIRKSDAAKMQMALGCELETWRECRVGFLNFRRKYLTFVEICWMDGEVYR